MSDTKPEDMSPDEAPRPWKAALQEEYGHWGVTEWMEIHDASGHEVDVDYTPDGKTYPVAALIVHAVNSLATMREERDALRAEVERLDDESSSRMNLLVEIDNKRTTFRDLLSSQTVQIALRKATADAEECKRVLDKLREIPDDVLRRHMTI